MRGVFQLGTGNRFEDITDGLSNTLLVGEKHVPISKFGIGGWDCSLYNGTRFTCSARTANRNLRLTTDPRSMSGGFGGSHTQVVLFAFADGRVQAVQESTDGRILELLVMRNDGLAVTEADYE